jgi:hypothetical protein
VGKGGLGPFSSRSGLSLAGVTPAHREHLATGMLSLLDLLGLLPSA